MAAIFGETKTFFYSAEIPCGSKILSKLLKRFRAKFWTLVGTKDYTFMASESDGAILDKF